jgi:hypothetical protein
MNRLALLALIASMALALGCPKRQPGGVTSSDDDLLDGYSAQMEELRSRLKMQEPSCEEWRSLAKSGCAVSRQVCEIATRNRDRGDMQQRCIDSQEDCARFNDGASACR